MKGFIYLKVFIEVFYCFTLYWHFFILFFLHSHCVACDMGGMSLLPLSDDHNQQKSYSKAKFLTRFVFPHSCLHLDHHWVKANLNTLNAFCKIL